MMTQTNLAINVSLNLGETKTVSGIKFCVKSNSGGSSLYYFNNGKWSLLRLVRPYNGVVRMLHSDVQTAQLWIRELGK